MDEAARKAKREYMRIWRARNAEKNKAYQDAYNKLYFANPVHAEEARQRTKQWYWDNRDKALAASSKYQAEHYIKKGRPKSLQHHNWKGDFVGYNALHLWVTRWRGNPSKCELCGTEAAKKYHWANKDHQYRRDLSDYIRTCAKCHWRYDYEHGLRGLPGQKK